jgi:hypothetical protein
MTRPCLVRSLAGLKYKINLLGSLLFTSLSLHEVRAISQIGLSNIYGSDHMYVSLSEIFCVKTDDDVYR